MEKGKDTILQSEGQCKATEPETETEAAKDDEAGNPQAVRDTGSLADPHGNAEEMAPDTSNGFVDSTSNLDVDAPRSPQQFPPLTEERCTNKGADHVDPTDEDTVEGERDGNSVSAESSPITCNLQHAVDPAESTEEAKVATTAVAVDVAEGGATLRNPPPAPLQPSPDEDMKPHLSVEQLKQLMKEAKAKEKADKKNCPR
jgi:hypothetical protein